MNKADFRIAIFWAFCAGTIFGHFLGQCQASVAHADPNDSVQRSTQKIADETSEISDTLKKIERKMR